MRGKAIACHDHLGNAYASRAQMCEAWRVPCSTFHRRISKGMSVEAALTLPPQGYLLPTKDHNGVEYNSFSELARAHGLLDTTLRHRLKIGIPLKYALETRVEGHEA